uniref:NADH-ubiquinone oxidoreductase chain 2 n=1 Tax=Allacma fusca TaxID=39272 RepID=A0A7D5BK72_9HEXA|nr:NADH dehydrogenase subunit 2 [Allacma fusca]
MFLKYSNSLFLFVLITTPLMVISSSSWSFIWMSLEINLMVFIPFLLSKMTPKYTNTAIKYFIIQSMGSILLMTSFIYSLLKSNNFELNLSNEILTMSLLIKSGIPPFHFWMPQIIENMNFTQVFMLITWQKVAPLFILALFISEMLTVIMIMSSLVGMLGGLNVNSTKKLLAYSSMAHSSWMLMSLMVNMKVWVSYFMIYSTMIIILTSSFHFMNIKKISSFMAINNMNSLKMILIINLMSMAGLPPFMGFLAKLSVMNQFMDKFNLIMISGMMILSSIVTLWFYMKMLYTSIFIKSAHPKISSIKNIYMYKLMMMLMVTANIMGPMIILFF